MCKLIFLTVLPIILSAQDSTQNKAASKWQLLGPKVTLGAIAGTSFTGDIGNHRFTSLELSSGNVSIFTTESGPKRLIAGPTIEFHLPQKLSVEIDALYRPVTTRYTSSFPGDLAGNRTSTDPTLEFPVLVKRRFSFRGMHPFIGAGPSFRSRTFFEQSHYGEAAGGGIEFLRGPLKIAPTLRYTHWGYQTNYVFVRRNQSEFLLGFSF
jgi:hypothetical protein